MRFLMVFVLLFSTATFASEIDIVHVVLTNNSGSWRADVTLKHADTGWKHYADGWRIVDEQGNVLANRVLYHPHVNEQPFTRSLSGFNIPKDENIIFVEAHDFERGWSKKRVKIYMSQNSGTHYKIHQ